MSESMVSPRINGGRESASAVSASNRSSMLNSQNVTPIKSSKKKKVAPQKVVKGQKLVSGFTHYLKPESA